MIMKCCKCDKKVSTSFYRSTNDYCMCDECGGFLLELSDYNGYYEWQEMSDPDLMLDDDLADCEFWTHIETEVL